MFTEYHKHTIFDSHNNVATLTTAFIFILTVQIDHNTPFWIIAQGVLQQ